MVAVNLVLVAFLIALTAFFVATEFAIVKIRTSRINQMIEEGNKNAVAVKHVISNLDEYLSACQLGITITALGLGWLGEPTLERLLHPLFHRFEINPSLSKILSFAIAFAVITFLHVVIGELAPKTFAIQRAERVSLLFARPIIWFYKIMFPFIWALNGSARLITSMFGINAASEHEVAHSEEELRILLSESLKRGEINQSEYKYVNKIFEFDNRLAKEVMVPRTEIVTASKNDIVEVFLKVAGIEKYTRYPVVEDSDKDRIIGLINIKEIYNDIIFNEKDGTETLESYIKPIMKVIETIPIHDLLVKMQTERVQMAILFDEYGGTAGLITVEDIVEEIVGEIRDEFDVDEIPDVQKIKEGHYILDGKMLITEVNDLLGTDINEEEVDTIAGWILTQDFDVGKGDIVRYDGYYFKVLIIDDHHIKYVEVKKRKKKEDE
ncbi:hemolysin family protein [Metabacillus iocasae]|uniref:CBS domain containing-hemolysin-like protein n=1 Tax=Priestia iocasae TaxID=2291674 RepID=A0ABS2QWR7_9BACI|nr:hemolysin family protein [Metabacillus iocasae]MBM7703850.1 CBS domain containing-hemolysin-like protein [Metabacillus iocasae]